MRYIILFLIIIILVFLLLFYNNKSDKNLEPFYSTTSAVFNPKKVPLPPKKNILLFTIETRSLDLVPIHNKNLEDYARKHNYKYIFMNQYKNKLILPIYWQKLQCMLDMIKTYPQYEYIMWLDSDSIISHTEIPLEYLIELSPTSSIFIGKDHPSGEEQPYCAGIFMIKNDKIGRKFIEDCINTYLNREKCISKNKYVLNGKWAGECYEQGIMNELLKTNYKSYLFHIPEYFLINDVNPLFGTVILHLYGDKNNAYSIFKNYLDCKPEFLPITASEYTPKCCIVLTMYIDKEKENLYYNIVNKWLKNTELDIYLVNSSGYILDISNPRLYQYSFLQKDKYNQKTGGPSIYERDSILKALSVFDFSAYDMVFKITGKYYMPKFKDILQYIPNDADVILQNQIITHGQNTEIIGIRPKFIKDIISLIDKNIPFEKVIKSLYCSYKMYRMPPLIPEIKVKRSDGSILDYL